jgi:hypothetical protein
MRIHLKKGRDGPSTLACIRNDGTRTWAHEHPFFPSHDLTHCAVESALGLDQAFFGLIAAGWEIDDFAQPGASKRMPFEALLAEHIVGILDRERGLPNVLTTAEVNEAIVASLSVAERAGFRPITPSQLVAVRSLRARLERRWRELAMGATLELEFPVSTAA